MLLFFLQLRNKLDNFLFLSRSNKRQCIFNLFSKSNRSNFYQFLLVSVFWDILLNFFWLTLLYFCLDIFWKCFINIGKCFYLIELFKFSNKLFFIVRILNNCQKF